jgi:PilZ domain
LLNSFKRLLLKRAPERYSRRWPRLGIAEPAQIRLPNGTNQPIIINQLSVGGARIQTPVPLRAGDNIELQFDHGEGGPQSLLGRIVYSCKETSSAYFGCGLCFLGLHSRESQWLAAYIAAEQAKRRAAQDPSPEQAPQPANP